jgi:hypothetical protein
MDDERPVIDVDLTEVQAALERIKQGQGTPEDLALIERLIESYVDLTRLVRARGTTIARLRRLFGLATSEKTDDVLGEGGPEGDPPGGEGQGAETPGSGGEAGAFAPPPAPGPESGDSGPSPGPAVGDPSDKKKRKGHGRRPSSDYADAPCIPVLHEALRPGETCPLCGQGKLYDTKRPAPIVRITGQPPLIAKRWLCQTLRCPTCGHLFTARLPKEAQGPKYDETAVSMIILVRYGVGLPHYRLAALQDNLRTPVPPSTQWDVVNEAVAVFRPVWGELCRLAAQSPLLHNDDSYVRVLEFMGKRRAKRLAQGELPDPDRTGLFTTAIVAVTAEGRRIVLFFSGRKHAGENLADLLGQRDPGLSPPVLMSDALDRNVPKGHPVVEANCLAHGRRHVCDEVTNFPAECAFLLKAIRRVYRVERLCRHFRLSDDQRLLVHQRWSGPVMDGIHQGAKAQLDEKRIELNSGMGKALQYLLRHWDKLTLFLRRSGVPLDNNVTEMVLKMAIRHRNNSLFFKTPHGAEVGDLFMSLIETTVLAGENAFDYLTEIQRHAKAVEADPAAWLPWTYRVTLARLAGAEPAVQVTPPAGPSVAIGRAPIAPACWLDPPPSVPATPPVATARTAPIPIPRSPPN